MKRLLATILSAAMLFAGFAVSAEDAYSVSVKTDYSADITTVEGDFGISYAYRRANIVVLNPGYTADDLVVEADAVNWTTQKSLDSDGKFSVSMSLSPSESSEDTVYTVLVAVDNASEIIVRTFEMYNDIYVNSVVDKIKDAVSDTDEEAIEGIIEDYIIILDIASTDEYQTFNDFNTNKKERVYSGIIDETPDSVESFAKAFSQAVKCVSLDDIADADEYKNAVLDIADSIADSVKKQIEAAKPDSELITSLKKVKFASEIQLVEKLYDFTVLKDINSSKIWSELASIYLKYADVLGIDTSAYEKLTGKKAAVTSLLGENFKTVESAAKAFDEAVEEQADKDDDNNSSSGGSSSGGGGSKSKGSVSIGGSAAAPVTPIVPQNSEPAAVSFNDLSGFEWAANAINTLSEKKIINGYADNSFAPDKNITRAEFVKILVSAFGVNKADNELNFADVSANQWYYSYINSAFSAGLINGVSETSFAPDAYITRQDIAVILNRYLKYTSDTQVSFVDEKAISDYAAEAVKALSSKKIINGYEDNSFRPLANASRAEVAVIISRVLNIKEGI